MRLRSSWLGMAGCCLWLGACAHPVPLVALGAAEAASVMVFGRGMADLGVSAISGRDCSLVRLERGQTYCAPLPRLAAEPYCTRSLGRVDCWAGPGLLPAAPAGVADTPAASPAQERYRQARWPKTLFAE